MADHSLHIDQVSHWFGDHRVLHNIDLQVGKGQVVALVGPSGCGKSTLLRAIVGTHPPCAGKIKTVIDGVEKEVITPGRDRGIVYQRYSLFPHLTAQENVAYGLMVDGTDIPHRLFSRGKWKETRKQHMEQAAELLKKMYLGEALHKYPPEMSGGMCQRVAIAQAMIMQPSVLLLDEPFGALDEATREELQRLILTIYDDNQKMIQSGEGQPVTVVIVTHELNEAIFVSNRVIGLSQYWDWKAAGETTCPGATIVYNEEAPVFLPGEQHDVSEFRDQKMDILKRVFKVEDQ